MSDAEMCWIRQRQLDISTKYNEGPWSDMDYTVWRASYNLGDISDWPLDAVAVRSAKPGERCLLGSVRSAADIFHVEVSTNTSVTVVVSVCWPAELRVRGAPQDWCEHFSRSGARHVQVELDDPRIKCNRDASWFSTAQSGAPRLGQTWLRLCALCASSANRRARSSTCSSIASVALIAVLLPSALGWCWTANAAQMKLWTASCRLGQLCNRGNAEIMLSLV